MTNLMLLAQELGTRLLQQNMFCTVAESCTGGLLAATITEVAGSSQWFECGFVTYSYPAKEKMLNVSAEILQEHGAVSEATVGAMVIGALALSNADVGIAISGIAGPTGGSVAKPVGTVWIAWGRKLQPPIAKCYLFTGNRSAIRQQAVAIAIEELIQLLYCAL